MSDSLADLEKRLKKNKVLLPRQIRTRATLDEERNGRRNRAEHSHANCEESCSTSPYVVKEFANAKFDPLNKKDSIYREVEDLQCGKNASTMIRTVAVTPDPVRETK